MDPFETWLAGRGPAPARVRVALAFGALLLGWLAGSAMSWWIEGLTAGGSGWADVLAFDVIIGLFALGAWLVSVLPLALFGNHDRWFFRPVAAPAVGAVCGVVLLLLEIWIFFGDPPWQIVRGGMDSGAVYLMTVAGVLGGVLWLAYTSWMHHRRRRRTRSVAG